MPNHPGVCEKWQALLPTSLGASSGTHSCASCLRSWWLLSVPGWCLPRWKQAWPGKRLGGDPRLPWNQGNHCFVLFFFLCIFKLVHLWKCSFELKSQSYLFWGNLIYRASDSPNFFFFSKNKSFESSYLSNDCHWSLCFWGHGKESGSLFFDTLLPHLATLSPHFDFDFPNFNWMLRVQLKFHTPWKPF